MHTCIQMTCWYAYMHKLTYIPHNTNTHEHIHAHVHMYMYAHMHCINSCMHICITHTIIHAYKHAFTNGWQTYMRKPWHNKLQTYMHACMHMCYTQTCINCNTCMHNIHVCICHMHANTFAHICTQTPKHTNMNASHTLIHVNTRRHTHIRACSQLWIPSLNSKIDACMCACMFECMHVSLHKCNAHIHASHTSTHVCTHARTCTQTRITQHAC